MRKEIVAPAPESTAPSGGSWMDLDSHSRVRLTSEDSDQPIEFALQDHGGKGWKAAQPGAQTIWIDFDVPQAIREIHLRFDATEQRTQEFVLLWSGDDGRTYREIVRQQFNFSPPTTSIEEETYFPHLKGVTDLKLTIIPDVSDGDARATLRALRIR
jgi:hypothetical protein